MKIEKMGNVGTQIKEIIDRENTSNSRKVAEILMLINFAVDILESNNIKENMGSIAIQSHVLHEKTKKFLEEE